MPTFDKNKQYRLENGWEYRNYADDAEGDYPIHGAYKRTGFSHWIAIQHGIDLSSNIDERFDLVEISTYEDFKKDEPVMVSDNGKNWDRRHFSHVQDGFPYTFQTGSTSWTALQRSVKWQHCRRPTEEELNGTT